MMTKEEAADLLDLIVERAADLRAAGVLSVELGGAGFTLARAEPSDSGGAPSDEEEGPGDVLRDVWTHGRPSPTSPKTVKVQRRSL